MFYLIAFAAGFVGTGTLCAIFAVHGVLRKTQGWRKISQFFASTLTFAIVILLVPYLLLYVGFLLGSGYGYGGMAVFLTAFLSCILVALTNMLMVGASLRKTSMKGYRRSHVLTLAVVGGASVVLLAAFL